MNTKYRLVTNAEEMQRAVDELSNKHAIGLDTETTDLDPYTARLRLIQLAAPDGVYIVDLHRFNDDMKRSEALASLRQMLAAPRPIKIAHNAKFDAKFIKHNLGVDIGGLFDTLLASQLVSAGDIEERHGLEAIAGRYLNETVDKSERLSNWEFDLSESQLQYPVVGKLLEYRTMQKALTSYGQNVVEFINPTTGRLHADFRQIGAPTGRFACTNPNIQQVPHTVEYRRCFMGHPEGRRLIIADYSQIELRILAEFSGDEAFIEAFNSGADLHRVTAAQVFNVAAEQVSREQRDFAKRLNFGVVYGIGAQRFSIMTGLSVKEAENVLRKYFATYRGLDNYLREAANRAVRERQARTGSGRLVRFRFDEQDRQQISMTQRNGKNTPIQGTSADILKRALRLLEDDLRDTTAKIVNIIHDEIVVEVDSDEAEEIAQKVERAMCAPGREYLRTVPVKVETEIASEWAK